MSRCKKQYSPITGRSPRIISFGEVLFDVIEDVPYLGGAPLNLAAHLQRLGADVTLVSAVGNDALGENALGQIRGLGLRTDGVAVLDPYATGKVTVSLDEKKIAHYEFSADTAYDHIPVPGNLPADPDLFCYGTLARRSPGTEASFEALKEQMHCRFFYDVNLRQNFYTKEIIASSLAAADIVKLNEEEFPALAAMFELPDDPEVMRQHFDLDMIILTLGPDGCDLYAGGDAIHSPAVPVKVVSTVGAGDSFSAAFLYHYLTGSTLEDALAAGNQLAAVVAGQKGAV